MLIIGKEDYEELKDCLSKTFEEIEKIKSERIKIDGEHFDVQWLVTIQLFLAKCNLFCDSLIFEMNVIDKA